VRQGDIAFNRTDDAVVVDIIAQLTTEIGDEGVTAVGAQRAGRRSVLLRIGELMFVEVVRRHLANLPAAVLFPARLPATTFGDLNFLAVSRDGSRFFIPQAVEQPESDVIDVRIGWAK
jgi:hypothetical protein